MPPQRSGDLLGPEPTARVAEDGAGASGGGVAGNGVFGAGLKVRGPNWCQYMLSEDWPRRGDATGDTYRCIRRDTQGYESIFAIKVAKSALKETSSSSQATNTAAWDQEVRLLRRLALLGGGATGNNSRSFSSDNLLGGAATTTTNSPAYTIEMVTEFGGLKSMPSLRFLVTTPVCWKSLDARIKGAERGYMEPYSAEQVRADF